MNAKPIVGITMGDPAGNGPEITVKALAHAEVYDSCRPIVVGDVKIIEQAARFVGRPDITIHRCEKVSDARFQQGVIDVLHLELIPDVEKFPIGQVSIEGGNAAFQCVKKVIELALAGEVDATCTNALNKEAMNKALEFYHGENSDGYTHFDGHTEIYATYKKIYHDVSPPRPESGSRFHPRLPQGGLRPGKEGPRSGGNRNRPQGVQRYGNREPEGSRSRSESPLR